MVTVEQKNLCFILHALWGMCVCDNLHCVYAFMWTQPGSRVGV